MNPTSNSKAEAGVARRRALGVLAIAAALALGDRSRAEVDLGRMTLGYTYYNRPGADVKAHDRDVADCARAAGGVHSVADVLSASPYGPLTAPRFNNRIDENLAAASLENCMVVRGWRVVRLADAEGKALAALPPGALAERLAPWIGASTPHGEITRIWRNDAARGATNRYSTWPGHTRNGQLSLLAGAPDLEALPPPPMRAPPSPWVNPRWVVRLIKPADLAAMRPEMGVVMVELKGLGLHDGIGIAFNRMGPDKDTFPSSLDHEGDRLFAGKGLLFTHAAGDMLVFTVPPGRWRIYGLGAMPLLNLCLGSPSFEVGAGEIVYAGAFDLGAEDIGPDLDLAPAKAWLAGQARSAEAAVYVNGSLGPCGDNTIYALEIKGAPFEAGYAWGSLAATGETAARAP